MVELEANMWSAVRETEQGGSQFYWFSGTGSSDFPHFRARNAETLLESRECPGTIHPQLVKEHCWGELLSRSGRLCCECRFAHAMFVSAQVVRCSSGKPNGRHSTCLLGFEPREDDFEWRSEQFKASSAII